MKRTGFKQPSASTGILRVQAHQRVAKARKTSKQAISADRAHMGRVAAMGCVLCEFLHGRDGTPAEVHHVRVRHGWGRSSNMAVIPLCPLHHRGQPGGIHDMGRDQFTDLYGISEMELLEAVNLEFGIAS